jgi:hypothetical protein
MALLTGWEACVWSFYIFRWMFCSHREKTRAPLGAVLLFTVIPTAVEMREKGANMTQSIESPRLSTSGRFTNRPYVTAEHCRAFNHVTISLAGPSS